MSLRVILARLTGTTSENSVLNGALALAKLFGGHIDALFVRPDPRMSIALTDDGFFPGAYEPLVSAIEREGIEMTHKVSKQFEKWRNLNNIIAGAALEGADRPTAEWHEAVGSEREILARAARLADVTVMARPTDSIEDRLDPALEAALSGTGRPVMLVPPVTHPDVAVSNILVAWNDSPEAVRAVSAALPLLQSAAKVTVVTAAEGAIEASAAEGLVDYLKQHGIHAVVFHNSRGKSNSVEDFLLTAAKKTKADVLVMGAYTHSRVREMVFGGVTRHMLSHAPIPVFMTH